MNSPIDDYLPEHYDYLQFAYYKSKYAMCVQKQSLLNIDILPDMTVEIVVRKP